MRKVLVISFFVFMSFIFLAPTTVRTGNTDNYGPPPLLTNSVTNLPSRIMSSCSYHGQAIKMVFCFDAMSHQRHYKTAYQLSELFFLFGYKPLMEPPLIFPVEIRIRQTVLFEPDSSYLSRSTAFGRQRTPSLYDEITIGIKTTTINTNGSGIANWEYTLLRELNPSNHESLEDLVRKITQIMEKI